MWFGGNILALSFLAWVDVERLIGPLSNIIYLALFSIWFNLIKFTVVFVSTILPFLGLSLRSLNYLGSFPINLSVLTCFFWSGKTCSISIYLLRNSLFLTNILFISSISFSQSLIYSRVFLAKKDSSLSLSSKKDDKAYFIESFSWGSDGSKWELC